MKKASVCLIAVFLATFLTACTTENPEIEVKETNNTESYSCSASEDQNSCSETSNESDEIDLESLTANATNIASKLWWLTPEDALEYMKNTKNLVIIDTRDLETKPNWFIWWMEIPYNQILERFSEIPEWRPVLLHCGWGGVAPKAYQALLEANVHLPELSYIAWTPLFDEYNNWVKSD